MTIRSRAFILLLLSASVVLLVPLARAQVPGQPGSSKSPAESFEQERQRGLVEQKAGIGTLREHDLPPEFVRRVADRIIRMQVQLQLRSAERPDSAVNDADEPMAHTATNESGQAGSSPIGMIVIALVFVAIVAVTHRKPATETKKPGKGRRK